MKLRNFKKAIHRVGYYMYHEPRILNSIQGWDDTEYVYYTCHRLSMTEHLFTRKREYVIRKKRDEE